MADDMNSLFEDSEDAMSITSSAPEDPEQHFEIDGGILAERDCEGQTQYLVKWRDYDETYNTWEPPESFDQEITLKEWRAKKMRVSRGLDAAFDFSAFEERVEEILNAKEQRKQRRRAKRARLHSAVITSSSSDKSDIESDAAPEIPPLPEQIPLQSRKKSKVTGSSVISPNEAEQNLEPTKYFTDQERRALVSGLTRVGFEWNEILRLFGPTGSINRDLRLKRSGDLRKETHKIRSELTNLGRDVPIWLQEKSDTVSAQKAAATKDTESNNVASRRIAADSTQTERPSSNENVPEATSSVTRPLIRTGTIYKGTARSLPSPPLESPDSVQNLPRRNSNQSSGLWATMHPSKAAPSSKSQTPKDRQSQKLQPASIERPSRPTMAPIKITNVPKPTATRSGMGVASTSNRRADVNKRFENLSTQNRSNKWMRRERTPDLAKQVFIDLKTGKPPKQTNSTPAIKEPLQRVSETPRSSEVEAEVPHGSIPTANALVDTTEDVIMSDDFTLPFVDGTHTMPQPKPKSPDDSPLFLPENQRSHPSDHDIKQKRTFALREKPSEDSVNKLFGYRVRESHVQGDILIGEPPDGLIPMRLQEFDKNLQRGLLSIKVGHQVHFDLRTRYTAADYKAFLHTVRVQNSAVGQNQY